MGFWNYKPNHAVACSVLSNGLHSMQNKIHDCCSVPTRRPGPRLLFSPLSEPLHGSVTMLHKHALFKHAIYVPTLNSQLSPQPLLRKLCVSLPWRSSSLSMAPLVPQTSPHSLHRPCCVSRCLVCFKTFSILTPSLSCCLCCSSAPLECRLWKCHVTHCLDTCSEQAFKLCFCG